MNKKVKEPFFWSRLLNMILGIAILGLITAMFFLDGGTEICEILIFALAAAANFIAAMICFVRMKKIRGNIYAVLCTVFLLLAVFLTVRINFV